MVEKRGENAKSAGFGSTWTTRTLHADIRGHWQVENCLHFVKDRWWDEDRHYTKRPGLTECFASLTNAALSRLRLIHPSGSPLRATAEAIQWNPLAILRSLGFQ
jgi:predicted transposase YbfD/YdcC